MNLTQLNFILSDKKLKEDLLELMKRKIEIEQSIASYDNDLDDIKKEVERLGLKNTEFNKIVKAVVNPEVVFNDLAALELINDHLISV